MNFTIQPVPETVLDEARRTGVDHAGTTTVRVTATGGEPLRCCLSDARPGQGLLLMGHDPALPAPSPYSEISPIFVHAEPCAGPADLHSWPADWASKPQALRAYDARGWIHDAAVVRSSGDAVLQVEAFLADPAVVEVHSANVAYGCWMFRVQRRG